MWFLIALAVIILAVIIFCSIIGCMVLYYKSKEIIAEFRWKEVRYYFKQKKEEEE